MSEKSKINRRQFIQRSGLGSAAMGMALGEGHGEAPEVPARVPASDKVTVGMIGVGARAQELMQAIMTLPGTEIVGVCDAYKGRTDRAVARTKGRAKVYKDYKELLADKSIDTVVNATTDHWPATTAIDAVRAAKAQSNEQPTTDADETA